MPEHSASAAADAHGHDPSSLVSVQFETVQQQRESATLGMWAFLVTEVLFFGGLFCMYAIDRWKYGDVFAEASHTLDLFLGTFNTAVLIGSSLTMALAVYSAHKGKKNAIVFWMIATMVLGSIFLGVKVVEYADKFSHHHVPGPSFEWHGHDPADAGPAQLYFGLYFAMTGMHAIHMIIGMGIMVVLVWMAYRGRFTEHYYMPIEIFGLYWHFVDIVWIFLFPLLYLIGGRHG